MASSARDVDLETRPYRRESNEPEPASRAFPRVRWTDAKGTREIAVERPMLVGSAAKADVAIADPTVSRLHAELELRTDGLWVKDLGSRNGTFVDGVHVGSARVRPGASIRLGATELTLASEPTLRSVEVWPEDHYGGLVGKTPVMRELFATFARVAPLDATVLVLGETGTGKELAARALHDASRRASSPFVIVDCGALPENLLEAELFGHAKGAFTGAVGARPGAIESAEEGTVFLDEIGELPLSMQPKLLRVLESRTVRRLGEATHRKVNVRFVTATHRDLGAMVNAGQFREDLYFRLAVVPVHMPPLRDHLDDVPLLAERFLAGLPAGKRAEIVASLAGRSWTGNVRELRNFLERAVALGTARALALASADRAAPPASSAPPVPEPSSLVYAQPFREFREDAEREYVRRLAEAHRGNVTAMAEAAGLDRTYVYRLIRKYA
jgi:DNA-binding NtrC family response regulator